MAGSGYSISKTSFLKFEQCPKAFFFYKNLPYLRDKPTIDKQITFKRGHDVGFFGQQLFPGGTDVSKITDSADSAIKKTLELLEQKEKVIYEATLVHNGVLIMVDILCLEEDGKYTAYEIKSSLRVSEVFLKDAFLQFYVLKNSLPAFNDLFLVTLNPDYRLDGEIDARKLFKKRSVGPKALENFEYLEFQINGANKLLENNIPNIPIGRQCFKPYQCDYFSVCWKDTITDKSVFNLPLADKGMLFEWHDSGLKNIEQIPDELIKKDALVKIKNAFVSNNPIIEKGKIASFLDRIEFPAAAMDMEVWGAALPQIQGTAPFEQIPFLVSFYDKQDFTYFFAGAGGDEREEFARQLILLSEKYKTILVYDKNLEVNVINTLAKRYPLLAGDLALLRQKLVDVFDVFLHMNYYHPAFKNTFSLKVVSSVLLENINYSGIGSGLEAMSYYEQFRLHDNPIEKEIIRDLLIDYCHTDTLATFGLVDFLRKTVSGS